MSSDKLQRALEQGADLWKRVAPGMSSSLSTIALSSWLGPESPIVAAAGGQFVGAITGTLSDVVGRVLSDRETARVGLAANHIFLRIEQYLHEGRAPRRDGFFERGVSHRSTAEELLEGVLLKCRAQHEERKCPHVAAIFANVAFSPDIPAETALFLIERADRLTYRQIVAMALAARGVTGTGKHSWGKYTNVSGADMKNPSLIAELRDVSDLIHAMGNSEEPPFLEPLGENLHRAMELADVPDDNVEALSQQIRRLASHSD